MKSTTALYASFHVAIEYTMSRDDAHYGTYHTLSHDLGDLIKTILCLELQFALHG